MGFRGIIQTEKDKNPNQIQFSKTAQMQPCCSRCRCTATMVLASMRGKELQIQKARRKDPKRKVLPLKARQGLIVEATRLQFWVKTYSLRKTASWLVVKIQTKKKSAARSSFRSYSWLSSWQHQLATKSDFYSLKNFL